MEESNNISSRYDAVVKQAVNFGIDAQRWYTVFDLKCQIALALGADVQDVNNCLSVYDVDYLIYKTYGGELSKLDLMSDYDVLLATIAILDSSIDTSLIDSEFIAEKTLINLLAPMTNEYFYVEPLSDNTEITINSVDGAPTLNLEYSLDGKRWQSWDYNTNNIKANAKKKVYLRGQNEEWTTIVGKEDNFYNYHYNSIISVGDAQFNIGGRLSSLFTGNDEETDKSIIMSAIFRKSACRDASELIVPKNAKLSYAFVECTSLISAPRRLSDTIIHKAQYKYIFQRCTSLLNAPELPSATLQESCYGYMFAECSSLVNAPALPAMSLKPYCYGYMFDSCSSLVEAPQLPAMSLNPYCYCSLFYRCSSLKKAPALPATSLEKGCYDFMFAECSSLVNAPALPATTLQRQCYEYMFAGCTSLVEAPALPATSLESYCYYQMFKRCSSLTKAPALPATSLEPECYAGMFAGCTSLVEAPALPATVSAYDCYYMMFQNCTSLVKAPALPATSLYKQCYYMMFQNCTSLVEAPALPATSLVSYCYAKMFSGCTSLTSFNFGDQRIYADLADSFTQMFNGCSKLSYIRCLYDDRDGRGPRAYTNWTSGVAPQGTFVTNTNMWKTGPNGIPNGWEVVIE